MTTTLTLQELKPSQIKPHKHNPRHDVGDVAELAASITAKGIVEPLIVAPNGTGATFTLVAGHRRLAAAKLAKCKTVPCIVRDDLADEGAQLEVMLVENLQRTDLSPMEEAEAYQLLLDLPDYTQKRISDSTGRSSRTISGRLKLAKLSEATRERIHTGQMTLADAQTLAEFLDEPETLAKLEEAIGTHQWRWTLQRAQEEREWAKRAVKIGRQLTASGVRVFTNEQVSALQDAAEEKGTEDGGKYVEPFIELDTDEAEDVYHPYGVFRTTIAEHAACPGHSAYISEDELDGDNNPLVSYICTEPERHAAERAAQRRGTGRFEPTTEDEKASVAAAAERSRLDAQQDIDLRTAAKVRRRFLGEQLAEVGREHAVAIVREQILEVVNGAARVFADALLPDRDDPDAPDAPATAKELRAAINAITSLEQLVALLDLANHAGQERELAMRWSWPATGQSWQVKNAAPWRQALEERWGYQWSDIEWELSERPGERPGT